MKKVLIFIFCLLLMGCSKDSSADAIKEFKSSVEKSKSYRLIGTMELRSDEETFNYDLEVSYLKEDYYKVQMRNTTSEQEQVILKNSEGLYVVTPALNKSFKFESSWPDNSSQAYILSSLVNDIENDDKASVEEKDGYIIKSTVNYPNNEELEYQKIHLDKDFNIKKVEVYSDADIAKIIVNFADVDLKAGLQKDEFALKNFIKENTCEEEACKTTTTMSKIESAIYPLYMPSNTYLSASEVINSDDESRIILTFSGDRNFVIVEETAAPGEEHEIVPIYGEPLMLNDTIAALSSNSMYWTNNDIEYYLVSNDLSVSEMVFIATSLGNAQATMATK